MAEVKWIKVATDIFDDDKILLIESMPDADSIIVIWFKLLCLAGKQNNSGVFMLNDKIPYTDEMLATIFRRGINTVRLALKTFEEFGMIEIISNTITIPNWEKHQQLDALERGREKTRERVARYREKQKLLAQGQCNVTAQVTETSSNGDRLDKNRIDDIDKDNARARAREEEFNPYGDSDYRPKVNTVQQYADLKLGALGPYEIEELNSFVDDLGEDVVMHGIDYGLNAGGRSWNYIKKVLNGYVECRVKTVDDAVKADEAYRGKSKGCNNQARRKRGVAGFDLTRNDNVPSLTRYDVPI